MKKRESSYTVGRNVNWCRYYGKDYGGSLKSKKQKVYKLATSVMAVEKEPPFKKKVFINYKGIHIYGCDFREIKGEMAKEENLNFLRQNGGDI